VLNLSTSATPQALMPATPQALREVGADLRQFTFFTSRTFEGGRERFRLHMGYFDTLEEAEEWLAVMRGVYPAAWAGLAAGQSEPRIARPAARGPSPAYRSSPPVLAVAQDRMPPARPSQARNTNLPVLPAARRESTLNDSQVLHFLEGGRGQQGVPTLRPQPRREAPRPRAENFAVQLQCSPYPLAIEDCPELPILSHYTLYAVEGVRAGERWFALRVGFFNDVESAKQVARSVRPDFATVAVVTISQQEVRSASGEDDSVEQLAPVPPARGRIPRALPAVYEEESYEDRLDLQDYAGAEPGGLPSTQSRKSWPMRLLASIGGRLRK
jgi:hypothetical protein